MRRRAGGATPFPDSCLSRREACDSGAFAMRLAASGMHERTTRSSHCRPRDYRAHYRAFSFGAMTNRATAICVSWRTHRSEKGSEKGRGRSGLSTGLSARTTAGQPFTSECATRDRARIRAASESDRRRHRAEFRFWNTGS